MGSTLRIIFTAVIAPFLLSGCSLFSDDVINCDEPQEYQESVSIPPLIVPDDLKNIQSKSIFNINNAQGSNTFIQENLVASKTTNKPINMPDQTNQMENIEGDELSELLQLIDQTISSRQVETQYLPVYQSITTGIDSDPSLEPCLDQAPTYFTEQISPRSMPTQTYTKSSEVSKTAESEKSRRQKRKEARQQRRAEKQSKEETKEDTSSKDTELSAESEENRTEKIFKIMTETAIGLYTGGLSQSITLRQGTSVTPPKPIKPVDKELAERVRNLALLNQELSAEQRVFMQNMSVEQILEIFYEAAKDLQSQESGDGVIPDEKENDGKISN